MNLPSDYAIGLPHVDAEHRILFDLLERLTSAAEDDDGNGTFELILERVGMNLAKHFTDEEAILRYCGMPPDRTDRHIAAHTTILEQYAALLFRSMHEMPPTAEEISASVRGWIIDHLIEHDLAMRDYVGQKN